MTRFQAWALVSGCVLVLALEAPGAWNEARAMWSGPYRTLQEGALDASRAPSAGAASSDLDRGLPLVDVSSAAAFLVHPWERTAGLPTIAFAGHELRISEGERAGR